MNVIVVAVHLNTIGKNSLHLAPINRIELGKFAKGSYGRHPVQYAVNDVRNIRDLSFKSSERHHQVPEVFAEYLRKIHFRGLPWK